MKEIKWTGIKDMTVTGIKLCVLYTAHKWIQNGSILIL
jgi:hypothetical protein